MGGKRTKLKAASSKQSTSRSEPQHPPATLTVYEKGELLIKAQLEHLQRLQAAVEQTLASGEATPALLRESASVARAVATISGELRLRERHHKQMAETLTDQERVALVADFVRRLPKEQRDQFQHAIDETDGKDPDSPLLS